MLTLGTVKFENHSLTLSAWFTLTKIRNYECMGFFFQNAVEQETRLFIC